MNFEGEAKIHTYVYYTHKYTYVHIDIAEKILYCFSFLISWNRGFISGSWCTDDPEIDLRWNVTKIFKLAAKFSRTHVRRPAWQTELWTQILIGILLRNENGERGNNNVKGEEGIFVVREFRVALYETIYCYICVSAKCCVMLLMRNVKTPFTRHGNSDLTQRVLTARAFAAWQKRYASAMRFCQSAVTTASCRFTIIPCLRCYRRRRVI